MARKVSEIMREMADREAIRDGLMRYARGVDRGDEQMLRSVYWPEATDNHGGFYCGSARGFVEKAIAYAHLTVVKSDHLLGNVYIDIHGDFADVESYVLAYEVHNGVLGIYDIVVGARYVDRWEKRDDEWRIQERNVIMDRVRAMPEKQDWERVFPPARDWQAALDSPQSRVSGLKPQDDSYALMNLADGSR